MIKNARRLLATAVLLTSLNTHAGVCNNGSLAGSYNFSGMGVTLGDSFHFVGRINFNGTGLATFLGVNTARGMEIRIGGSGAYNVSAVCTGSGFINFTNGLRVTFWGYLDQMDFAPSANLAYHATIGLLTNAGDSASGELIRVQGKF